VCIKQDQEMKQGIHLPVLHTLSDHHMCHGVSPLGCHVKNGSFSSANMNCMSMGSIIWLFYHLNKMSIATKHIADNIVQTSQLPHFLTYDRNNPEVMGEPHSL